MKNSKADYDGFIEQCRTFFDKYGEDKSNRFIKYVKSVCDSKKRVFLDKRFMWMLYDDYCLVKVSGIRWYAVVGSGGTGKTTLAKNIGCFLDTTFNASRICFDTDDFVKNLIKFPEIDAMKSICLDEPDQDIHPSSKKGKKLRDILGKARSQKIFAIFCATDMYDIPDYIYKKITGIFFCNVKGKAIYYRDQPNNSVYIISKLKLLYKIHGYKCFYLPEFKKFGVRGDTKAATPLTTRDENKYLKSKITDYVKTLNEFKTKKVRKELPTSKRNKDIVAMRNGGASHKTIAKKWNITDRRSANIYHAYKNKSK